jgi:predicted nuclease of predicted toxin-antitoxin system
MIFWVDAQLPPQLATWLTQKYGVQALALRTVGLRDAADRQIFEAARTAGVVLISKDIDFVDLVQRFGPPPQLLWVTCGNVTNHRLQQVFSATFERAASLLREGGTVVEIGDAP